MLKVLHFYKTYYPDSFGGIEQVIFQLCEGGAHRGIDSTVLSLSKRGSIVNQKIGAHTVYCSPVNFEAASTPFSFQAIKDFKKLAQQADIIHYHFPFPFMDMVHFISGINKPTVVSYHSDIVKQKNIFKIYAPLMNRFLSDVSHIVAASPNYVATSVTLKKFVHKVSVIPYGLDEKSYPTPTFERLQFWENKFGLRFFLFIGAFRYYKGLHILIEAAENSTYPIVIVGAGPIESELKRQVKELKIENIHFLGAVSDEDKAALLTLCYAVVFPSHLRSEAFGITLLEGAMYGKPLISSEIGTGTTFINIDQQTGLVVPPSDPVALRTAMDQLWDDIELSEKFGRNARNRYLENFTSEKMVSSYIDLYNQVIDK
ncbi:TPA: glycosyltransferase family 4 protein [Yersinia enterocolitica]|nr:glycosyltransferase family 4 protein [Yersinia enterocolitica]HDL7823089.1 glycosyltransferase family 4 protein [Yersinia enterocolitica]HDL7832286.1 glycosyltransferase family 4 protein [Yersinia enterocolitica]HDL7872941.1 glycosyltransferase family 4 protein [Yersinia enterocolitica]HDL7885186.1 glycosyltransferase family 4 protein [Yersinia enterocolitica]